MKASIPREFTSADLYLSSAICILLQTLPQYRVENGKTLFVFLVEDSLYKAMTAYNAGVSLNAIEFVQMIKRLRAEMLLRRGMVSEVPRRG